MDSTTKNNYSSRTLKALKILSALKQTSTGVVIYEHIQDILETQETEQLSIQEAYADLLNTVLDVYEQQLPADSINHTQIKLIRARLAPPLDASEINKLHGYIRNITQLNQQQAGLQGKGEDLKEAISPLVKEFGTTAPVESPAQLQAEEQIAATIEKQAPVSIADESKPPAFDRDTVVDTAYKKHLDDKRKRILNIQETLAQHVAEVIKQNEKFGVLLEVENDAIRRTDDIEELNNLKQSLLDEVENLTRGHHNLSAKLDNASKYLQIIETEGQDLNEELTRVHILSLTDELTELPNRRAFMRRIEDEVARVQRYGSPLSLGLIDLDGFKAINDELGHAAGDEVLRCFSSNILSTFRHHDLVARYGGEEFAVLFPNTDIEGAKRAMEKVRGRAEQTTYQFDDANLPMPTFSAGIALYKPGETPSSLIERADNALYTAKRLGRNRIEIASLADVSDSSS